MLIKRKSIEKEESSRPASTPAPAARRKIKYAPVTLSEQDGVRYLHFGTEWVQGAMRIRKPNWPELEYAQQMMAWMLWLEQPRRIAQLGLGTAALTKFCYTTFPEAQVAAIELNPSVIAICESMFKLPPNDARLHVQEMDALDFVNDKANLGTLDALQVDLYDATARGPVLDTPEFYQSCNACLNDDGVMTVNLFGDHPSYARNLKAIKFAFAQVICLPQVHDGNVVAIAFKRQRDIDPAALAARAAQIVADTKLPAKSWVTGIKAGITAK
ncbi:spermidine synthase [Pseudoduganella sp. FT25W]|uniref:Spermidine synthase n=1 Tax=Duganella alba TaxID=2666081 RepID=A0A6L5QC81_9BURK|nr:spermidine synthase [Duganella alba]MRX07190.1 spermidine synthase [Duganella alba]MRX15115.1 spermidine synthase [Duganella alba]